MDDRKYVVLFVVLVSYSIYNVHVWFSSTDTISEISEKEKVADTNTAIELLDDHKNKTEEAENNTITIKKEPIPLFMRNACSVLEVFTIKPFPKRNYRPKDMEDGSKALAVFGITVFLVILAMNAILDVIKVREEERLKKLQNPVEERRQSLAGFANKKPLRRESSKLGSQLFQITEPEIPKETQQKAKVPYTRGESTNSYLSENITDGDAVTASFDTNSVDGLSKRPSVAKISGARGLLRQSSTPALPHNPDVHILSRTRQPSTDSDDEDKGRRIRMIRRF